MAARVRWGAYSSRALAQGGLLDLMSWDVVGPLMIVDLPFSVVLDTVLMSIDLIDNRPCNW
ncbi:YceK/YidQ family lipoprotein [Pseudomonas nitroreducens]|uniref:YceK/YidQ family lipoprotein n=1 Tax=Pseudomonas nitroreducens TaxID=46680 RepID=A0A5R9AJA8_PSENT|nr:YceK/YidQ family lipoprotein [Pseudomonas nitroreducens]